MRRPASQWLMARNADVDTEHSSILRSLLTLTSYMSVSKARWPPEVQRQMTKSCDTFSVRQASIDHAQSRDSLP